MPNSPCLFLTTCARKCQGFTRHRAVGDAHQESVWGAFKQSMLLPIGHHKENAATNGAAGGSIATNVPYTLAQP